MSDTDVFMMFYGNGIALRRTGRVMLLSILLIVAGVVADAATVRGRVVFPNGNPAAGVAVTVNHPQYGRSPPAFSGPDGMYYLNGIPPGNYTLEVWTSNQSFISIIITVYEPVTDVAPVVVP
jgi:hypothetical protein